MKIIPVAPVKINPKLLKSALPFDQSVLTSFHSVDRIGSSAAEKIRKVNFISGRKKQPGESLTLYPGCYHEFTVGPEDAYALIGEVSMCNDDKADNRFEKPTGRFPAIEEDEPAYRLLCNEYPPAG